MHIQKIVVEQDPILGNNTLEFEESKKACLKPKVPSTVKIVLDTTRNGNYYTFFYGENGVGKTSLFKSLGNANSYSRSYYFAHSHIEDIKLNLGFNMFVNPFVLGDGLLFTRAYKNTKKELKSLEEKICKKFTGEISVKVKYTQAYEYVYFPMTAGVSFMHLMECVSDIKFAPKLCDILRCFLSQAIGQDKLYGVLKENVNEQKFDKFQKLFKKFSPFYDCYKETFEEYKKDNSDDFGRFVFEHEEVLDKNYRFKIDKLNDIENAILCLLSEMGLIDIGIIWCEESTEREVCHNQFSTGEKTLLHIFLEFSLIPSKRDNCLILIDEPEISLHPRWQQSIPEFFRLVAEDIFNIKHSHFIFATHSPLVLIRSKYIPNSQAIKLYRDKNGNIASEQKSDIRSYCLEELLLDEFSATYVEQEKNLKNTIYGKKNQKKLALDEIPEKLIKEIDTETLKSNIKKLYEDILE